MTNESVKREGETNGYCDYCLDGHCDDCMGPPCACFVKQAGVV